MHWQRSQLIFTLFNLVLLLVTLSQWRPVDAKDVVLRGRGLELVDTSGRVRAELKVLPADPAVKMPDGSVGYPETVQLRLIDSQGGPNVKLAAMEDGSGLVLGGGRGYVQILSRGHGPLVKLVTNDGRERIIDLGPENARSR